MTDFDLICIGVSESRRGALLWVVSVPTSGADVERRGAAEVVSENFTLSGQPMVLQVWVSCRQLGVTGK